MMFRSGFRLSRFIVLLLVVLVFGIVSSGFAVAQEVIPLQYGTVTVGTVSANNAQVMYSFNGTAGDLVTIQALGTAPDWQPNVTLVSPSQQPLAISSDHEPLGFMSSGAQIVARLQETGTYSIVVSGTPGDFLLTLAARPPLTSTALSLNTPVNVSLPLAEPAPVFVFNTDPTLATTLLIDADPGDLNADIEIRNGLGQVISVLRGSVDNACISFGPGDEVDELTITAGPDITGVVTFTLSNAPCELGDAPSQVVAATPQFVPITIEGVCAASTFRNVNIRSGPSTIFGIMGILPARQPIQVVGRNEDGTWLAVQSSFVQGWVSSSVVATAGPCDGLPVVAPPALPAASPTPGFPVVTVVVTVVAPTATPEATAEPTEEATESPVPSATVEETAEVTAAP